MESTEETKLKELIYEIISTERSYCEALTMFNGNFLAPMFLGDDLVSKRNQHLVVSNTPDVLGVSRRFLEQLELVWNSTYHSNLLESICALIDEFCEKHFDVYVRYCGNMDHQRRKYQELLKSNQTFTDAIATCKMIPEMEKLPLDSFFLLPMQRITRLPLLIEKICEKTSSKRYSYGQMAQKTLQSLQRVVRKCNEMARQMASMEQIATLDPQLDFGNLKKIPIVSMNRHLVKQGQLIQLVRPAHRLYVNKITEHRTTIYIFLFNDLILVTKPKEKESDKYEVLDYTYRNHIEARSLHRPELAKYFSQHFVKSCQHVMLVAFVENAQQKSQEYFFSCETLSDRERWVDALTSTKQVSPDEILYEAWDLPQVKAIEAYWPVQEDELFFEVGDVLNVHKKMSDGWYYGERITDGARGWFPAMATEEVQNLHVRARNKRQRYRLLVCSYMEWKEDDGNKNSELFKLDIPVPVLEPTFEDDEIEPPWIPKNNRERPEDVDLDTPIPVSDGHPLRDYAAAH